MGSLNSIEDILVDIREGRMVVLMDDEDRENEGDLIMAASKVRPEDVNFMAKYGRGLICLTLTRDRCRQLRLPLMVSENAVKLMAWMTMPAIWRWRRPSRSLPAAAASSMCSSRRDISGT